MLFKSLEMMGFKSFVDRVNVEFTSGLTAIIGPNGCGKSNVSDAVRWVMGEQSVKTLRGSRMEDVIFAGSEKRGPVGFAEVTMTLNNESRLFNVDFEEVAITRRLYRSGESEYMINRVPCRLKDIHELLMDTGLGRDGYSVIGQGRIDEILYAKPEDRREMFEEAAGISKYKYKKIEAERKLAATDNNITRIADILSEITGQLEPLRKQSEKAERFLTCRDELKILDVNLFFDAIEKSDKTKEKLEADVATLTRELAEKKAAVDSVQDTVTGLHQKNREKEQATEEARESRSQTEQLITALNAEAEKCDTLIHANEEQAMRYRKEAQELAEEEEKRGEKAEALKHEKQEAEKKLQEAKDMVAAAKEKEEEAAGFVTEQGKKIDAIREEQQKVALLHSDAKSKIESFADTRADLGARIADMEEERERNRENTTRQEQTKKELEQAIVDAEEKKKTLRIEQNQYTEKLMALKKKREAGQSEYNALVHKENGLVSRLHVLEELEKEMEDVYGETVEYVLNGDVVTLIVLR